MLSRNFALKQRNEAEVNRVRRAREVLALLFLFIIYLFIYFLLFGPAAWPVGS